MASTFTVQDTRRFAAPRMTLAEADGFGLPLAADDGSSPVRAAGVPPRAALLAHDACSTGAPAWTGDGRRSPRSAATNCRLLAVAADADPSLTARDVAARSLTTRTGVMPHRPSLGDRLASVIILLNAAFHHQLLVFRALQARLRDAGAALGAELVPEDMMEFEWTLQWKELRDEMTAMLRQHWTAVASLAALARGTRPFAEAAAVAQRTSPDAIAMALSGLTIFDPIKWGADTLPYDAATIAAATTIAATTIDDDAEGSTTTPPPAMAAACDLPAWMRGAGQQPLENDSFIPSPGQGSRAVSPYPQSAAVPAEAAAENMDGDVEPDSFGAVPVDELSSDRGSACAADSVASPPKPASPATTQQQQQPQQPPLVVAAVERPPRPASLADCMDPDAIAARQAAANEYRMRVLHAAGVLVA